MQKKQIIQFATLLVFLAAMAGAYFGIQSYNSAQEEKERKEQEDAKITLTAFQPDDITQIRYDYNGKTYRFQKSGKKWKSKGDSSLDIDQGKFEDFLKSAGSIQAQAKVDADAGASSTEKTGSADTEYGFDKPTRTVKITRGKGSSFLTFGMKNEMLGQYYVRTSESSQVYLVEESVYTAFDKEPGDFRKEEAANTDT